MVHLSWWSWCAQLGLASALVVGMINAKGDRAYAQSKITPDATLGSERSVVTPNVPINGLPSDQIDGGATRGSNLFHASKAARNCQAAISPGCYDDRPATGWVFNNKGEVTLIAQAPNATPEIGSNRIPCHVSSK